MKLFIKAFLILLPFTALGQNKTYLGLEIGPKFENYDFIDNGDGLYTEPFFFSPIYGLTLGQELNQRFALETGFYINNYGESYRIEGESGYFASNAILAYQIPFRLKVRLNLLKEKLSLVSTVGYNFAINSEYSPNGPTSGSRQNFSTGVGPQINDSTRTQDISTYFQEKTYGLFEVGLALEYKFKKSTAIYLSANYLAGFKRLVEMDVKYWINDEPEQTGTVFSEGEYGSIVFGIKYSISNLWAKKSAD